ncbi:MAG: ATP synthase F1 subunit delta [Flavobacteriales bacterium]|nr:ATP synthase F1 subunit delta [Flavobacteriales bacterium]
MKGSLASKRYAKSLLTLALEQNNLDKVYADMKLLSQAVEDSKDLKSLLNNPIIKSDKKNSILSAIFGGKIEELSSKFIALVTNKGREILLPTIAKAFEDAYRDYKNISTVEVTSAVALSEEQKKRILAIAAKQGVANAEVIEKVDASLIGGFIMRMGDKQIDASISHRINTLKQELIKN